MNLHAKHAHPNVNSLSHMASLQVVVELAVEAKASVMQEVQTVVAAGTLVSVSLDLWGENGIALLGMMATYIDTKWTIQERLIRAAPMGGTRHSGVNIRHELGIACSALGLAAWHNGVSIRRFYLSVGPLCMFRPLLTGVGVCWRHRIGVSVRTASSTSLQTTRPT